MRKILRSYLRLESHIINILLAVFFTHLINASFFLLINYYMDAEGYADYEIANFVSYRFLAVMIFAFPLGIFIKGRRLKPFFYLASVFTPTLALLIIYATEMHYDRLLFVGMAFWGVAFTFIQVTALPFILLNAKKETHSEAFALYFLCRSASLALCGAISFLLNHFVPHLFDVKLLLQLFAIIGFTSLFFVYRINIKETLTKQVHLPHFFGHYDWGLIVKAIVPTFLIAVGAGFTIPFINLFFLNIHDVSADAFSLMAAVTFVLVAMGMFIIPTIKRRFGYKIAITLIQSVSVIMLVLMATTEFYNHLWFAVYLAIFFYVIRQPLMNVAGPMTSELTMYYVGKRNQELVSALNASIWSGSWFISSQIFRVLRSNGLQYAYIFLITAALYIIGVVLYYFLILDYQKRTRLGLTDF